MARIIPLTTNEQIHHAISAAGYNILLLIQQHDLPSSLTMSQCARYSREYPFVKFYSIDIGQNSDLIHQFGLSYVPTMMFYRNGRKIHQLVGTDYATIERMLNSARVDGYGLSVRR